MRSSESAPGRTRPSGPRDVAAAAEEGLEHVAQPTETGGEPVAGRGVFHRVTAQVDDAPLLGVGQHLVGELISLNFAAPPRRG